MKKLVLSVLLGGLAMATAFADDLQPPHVTVYGTAVTEVIPDEMHWSVKVLNKGPALDSVASEHTRIVQTAMQLLKDAGVEGKTIQTSSMEFGENWEYKNSERAQNGYFALTVISFKLTDFGLYNKLWLGLAKLPSVSVENVAYDHTKRIDFQNETRRKAVMAAREKAEALASALGSAIGEPLLIEEQVVENNWAANSAMNNLRQVSDEEVAGAEGVAPGKIPIRTRVRASFRLMTNQK